jgi:hypothetical protein
MAKQAPRGGRRRGPGRPAFLRDRVRFLVDLEREQLDWLRRTAAESKSSVSELIRVMVSARMRRRRS